MYGKIGNELKTELDGIVRSGLYKSERYIASPQEARIRVQISAAHSEDDLCFAVEKFAKVGRELQVIT